MPTDVGQQYRGTALNRWHFTGAEFKFMSPIPRAQREQWHSAGVRRCSRGSIFGPHIFSTLIPEKSPFDSYVSGPHFEKPAFEARIFLPTSQKSRLQNLQNWNGISA
jgi:hypothetical protein